MRMRIQTRVRAQLATRRHRRAAAGIVIPCLLPHVTFFTFFTFFTGAIVAVVADAASVLIIGSARWRRGAARRRPSRRRSGSRQWCEQLGHHRRDGHLRHALRRAVH